MTDSELSAAIAEAVRPVFDCAVSVKRGPMKATLAWFNERGQWVYGWNDPATINQTFNPIPPRWAAAILLHELAGREDGAEATWKIKELLRAQA